MTAIIRKRLPFRQDETNIRADVIPILFLFLAGLAALGFLIVVGRRRQMPPALRGALIIAAAIVVTYVGWTILAAFKL